jgi:cysteine synthase A
MRIANSVKDLVGRTPLVRLNRISEETGLELVAKLEYFNPASSVKDRIGIEMLEDAERKGIKKGSNFVEPTSGNTGIALAWACAVKGYNLTLTMPESASDERIKLLKLLGAKVILTPAEKGMVGAVEKAEELKAHGYYMCDQFSSRINVEAHRKTTAIEIWDDTDGMVEGVVAGVGTGGTITGIAEILKERKKSVKIIAVEPEESPVLTEIKNNEKVEPHAHRIQGIGAGFVPGIFRMDLIDEIVTVSAEESADFMLRLAREEGILAGISSGAAVCGAVKAARLFEGGVVVVILPDTVERYMSTDWLWEHWKI